MHRGKVLTISSYRLQPFTIDLHPKYEMITDGLLDLFSRDEVIKYNLNRKLATREAATIKLYDTLNGYEKEISYDYFLFDLERDKMIGFIGLIGPKTVKKAYPLLPMLPSIKQAKENIWMIEFYLHPKYWGHGIMGAFTGAITNTLFEQGASLVGALVDENNLPSQRMLKKVKFKLNPEYKDLQNQHLYILDISGNQ